MFFNKQKEINKKNLQSTLYYNSLLLLLYCSLLDMYKGHFTRSMKEIGIKDD
jgi:hypothetical protein